MNSEQQNNTNSSAPSLCVNDCGFFGAAATGGMCSKCFRESGKSQTLQVKELSIIEAARSSEAKTSIPGVATAGDMEIDVAPSENASPVFVPQAPTVEIIAKEASPVSLGEIVSEIPAVPVVDAPLEVVAVEGAKIEPVQVPAVKLQKAGRCYQCDKKVGLLGFTCRCDFTFCGSHRMADNHCCTFDYKSMKRDQLSNENQAVIADKLQKF